jgi:3-hydroxyacyl-CoA dehydrogenase
VTKAITGLARQEPAPLGAKDRAASIEAANYGSDLARLAECDLVIEAIAERLDWKRDLYEKIAPHLPPRAILASNTSFLNLDVIADATRRPEDVVGLHFFSPANVMRLLEVVRGAKTRKQVVATAMSLARTIRKVPVLSRVGYGFIANRVMAARMAEADSLVLEGPTPTEVDRAIYEFGFAMGPFRMIDLVGLDVIGRDSDERTLAGDLVKRGRLGQKMNGGFYDYDEKRNPTPSAVAAEVIAEFAASKGVRNTGPLQADEIVARLLYPVVNEGARVLEEGIALRASDIDVACVLGYGWPVQTGGPMFWGDTVGLSRIVEGLRARGVRPANLLIEKAANGGSFTR